MSEVAMGEKLLSLLSGESYCAPDFSSSAFRSSPVASFEPAPADGVAPEGFHATSNHPEYIKSEDGSWHLLRESRMDAVIVWRHGSFDVVEGRRLKKGELVVLGRSEDGQEGILVHTEGFPDQEARQEKFAFRTRGTRESPFSSRYEELYQVLRHDRDHGSIVWVAGPAVVFDQDSRNSLAQLIDAGFCHGLLAGNALATHDLEAGFYGTALGQDIYDQRILSGGHYHHLDILNGVRRAGSIQQAFQSLEGTDSGVMGALERNAIPYVLAGSIRDDGPLPEVEADVYRAQDAMRLHARQATTVVALATQLHSIAFANQLPGYRVLNDGKVRPVMLVVVDTTEFSADKLANRGSGQARAFLTNVQDFMTHLARNLVESVK
ncbi:MAG: hypothetical protein MK135_00650 [Polyangiaceae bacterium]|nr:hypothetical protein [Polyangiaceae bacterium]